MEKEIRIPVNGRDLDAYLVVPDSPTGRHPAVVIIHEIFGLDEHFRDVARRFGRHGYVALAPNLFSGELAQVLTPPNIQLAMQALATAPPDLRANPAKMSEFAAAQPAEQRPVLEALARVSDPMVQAGFADDLARTTAFLRGHPSVDDDRIGSVGFCFGGAMSGLLATVDPKLRAAIILYGQNPPLDRVPSIRAHLLGLYGAEDPRITDKVPELAAAMKAAGRSFDYHVYPGARHAFFNDTRAATYHRESAEDAWKRILAFFGTELSGAR